MGAERVEARSPRLVASADAEGRHASIAVTNCKVLTDSAPVAWLAMHSAVATERNGVSR